MSVLRVADVGGTWTSVRLVTELWKREPPRAFAKRAAAWELELGPLPVDRLEYLVEVEHADGTVEQICAPGAPTAAQPFGDKSVLVLDAYQVPGWLAEQTPAGTVEPLSLPSEYLGTVAGQLWSPPGLAANVSAPLLVVLDGSDYLRFAALDRYLAAAIAAHELPPMRAALLDPGARDDEYSASDAFAAALADELVPALERQTPVTTRIGLGASLGGLALLHAHRRSPALFGALVLQSGSFFDDKLDDQEHGFRWFERITTFVREVVTTPTYATPIPIAITCGTGEENLANNRAMARALAAQGYRVASHEVRDAHNWVCWRDAFASVLTARLLGLAEDAPATGA